MELRSERSSLCTAKCTFAEVYAVDLVRCLTRANLWPTSSLRNRTLYEILEDEMPLLEETRDERCVSCDNSYSSTCAVRNSMDVKAAGLVYRYKAGMLITGIRKACLQCCEEGKGLPDAKCEHTV